jgi:hypothetical protein
MKIKDIRLDKDLQSRAYINEDTVAEYAEHMLDGAKFPPVTLFFDSVYYWLADGYHRYYGYKKAGIEDIEIEVINGTRRDAILYSLGANSKHGLPRSNDDKRKAVMTLLDDMEWCEWADREIARVCGVSSMTVGRIKKSLQIDKPSEKKYIKDGVEKVMKTDNIGKEVTSLKPAEVFIEDDKLAEMAVAHQELADENAKLMDKIQAVELSDDQQAIDDKFTEYRNQIKALEAELRAVKNSRDQFQQKNAELIKQVAYWRKKAEKAEKVN